MGLGKIISHLKWIKNGNIFFLFLKIYIHTSTLTHVHPVGFNDQDCICVDGNRNQRPSGFNSTSVSQMERSSPLYNIIEPLLYIYIFFIKTRQMDDCTCPSQNMHTFAELERLASIHTDFWGPIHVQWISLWHLGIKTHNSIYDLIGCSMTSFNWPIMWDTQLLPRKSLFNKTQRF